VIRRVGFTGSREAPTAPQRRALAQWMLERGVSELHHGDCVGSDKVAHMLARLFGWRVVVHPGMGPANLRAFVSNYEELRAAKPNLERNGDIATETDELVACPSGPETLRSGTWATIRRARKLGRRINIFWPDGTATCEPNEVAGAAE